MSELDDIIAGGNSQTPGSVPHKGNELDDIIASAAPPPDKPITADTPWSDVLSQGAHNLGPSAVNWGKNIVGGIAQAVSDPVGTAKGVGALGKGTYDYLAGNDTPESQLAQNIGSGLKHDWATEEGWKQQIATDPFGRAMDVGALMTAPEALAGKAGLEGVATGLRSANPATWVAGGAGMAADASRKVLGSAISEMGTHTGTAWNTLFEGARKSEDLYRAGRAGQLSQNDALDAVKKFDEASDMIRNDGYARYQANEKLLAGDQQRLSYKPIYDALDDVDRKFSDPFSTVPNPTDGVRQQMRDIIDKERAAAQQYDFQQTMIANQMGVGPQGNIGTVVGPNPHLDPLGMDKLKQSIGEVKNASDGKSYAAANAVYQAISDQLKTKASGYSEMMSDYSKMKEARNAYDRELSLGGSPDTALRKLYSSLRPNVAANFSQRSKYVQQLAARSPEAEKALVGLAGNAMSSWFPRGLVGSFKSGIAPWAGLGGELYGLHMLSPYMMPAVLAQSPRIMGRTALGLGRATRLGSHVPWRPLAAGAANYASAPPWSQLAPAMAYGSGSPYAVNQ